MKHEVNGEFDPSGEAIKDIRQSDPLAKFRKFTRREFLKLSAVTWTALTLSLQPDGTHEIKFDESNYQFQFDLPSGYALIRTGMFDSVYGLSRKAEVPVDQMRNENGINSDTYFISQKYILVPISPMSSLNYVDKDDPDLKEQLVVRAVRNPLLPPDQDFTDQEMAIINNLLLWAESTKRKYLGNIDMTRGFARLVRGSEGEISHDPTHTSGEVQTTPEGAKVLVVYPGSSSLNAYNYFESLSLGYGLDRYLAYMANLVLHEVGHLVIKPDLDIFPFVNHDLIKAIASLASDAYPDKGYMAEGRHIPGTVYTINTVEWYLIRQNSDFFKRLLPHYLKYYQKERPNLAEVDGWIDDIYPNYFRWKQMYDTPITEEKIPRDGKQFVWARKSSAFDEVTWAVPNYNVRWPLVEETQTGWLADHGFSPIRKDGMLLYRSWKVVGVSKVGNVPDFIDTATAMAFSSDDPDYFTKTADGKNRVSPTMDAVYSVGEWK